MTIRRQIVWDIENKKIVPGVAGDSVFYSGDNTFYGETLFKNSVVVSGDIIFSGDSTFAGGLVIENRVDTPSGDIAIGRIWYRTDLD